MSGILLGTVLFAFLTNWQTYTNTNCINDICGDDSVLHLATIGGVVFLDIRSTPKVIRTYTHLDGLGANRCLAVGRDDSGNVWVGTDGTSLAVIPAGADSGFAYPSFELPSVIQTLKVMKDRLFIGTGQGLYVIKLSGSKLDFSDDTIYHFSYARVRELLSDRILSILLTQDGYWIGTNQGLTYVDTAFRVWRAYRRPLGDSVRALAVLPDSRVVAATERGIVVGDTGGFNPILTFYQVKTVNALLTDGFDIYLGTADTLFKLDTGGLLQPVLTGDVRALWLGRTFWVGLGGNEEWGWGLRYLRSGQAWESFYFPCVASGLTSDCIWAKDSSIYVAHNSGNVSRIMPDGRVRVIPAPLPWAVQVRSDSRGLVWFSHFYPGGLSAYDPLADTWGTIQWGSGDRNVIQAFGIDRFDTKWVFNKSGSIIAIDSTGNQAEFYLPELVPPPGGNYEFAFDSLNRVWLGLTNGLAEFDYNGTLFNPGDDRHRLLNQGLPANEVRSVAVDPWNRVWVATPQGAAVWNGSRFKVYTTTNSRLLSNNVSRVRVDGAGRVWFLTDEGLSIFDQVSNTWTTVTGKDGLIPNYQALTGFYTALSLSDQEGMGVVGTIRGVSVFSYARPPDTVFLEVKVHPNPCILGINNGVIIDGLPQDAIVRIYSLSGKMVANLKVSPGSGRAVWLPQPGKVASGVYLIVATSKKGIMVERVALVVR